MRHIPFVKYTCYGNNFVIVDQASEKSLSEEEMSLFARAATDTAFGIGCDNLLVVQPCNPDVLREISAAHGYWTRPPVAKRADFIFRMFEPDGQEALCCGNGLACIADYLGQHHQQADVTILTEVPLQRPSTLRIGSIRDGNTSWVGLGEPRRTPPELVTPGWTIPCTGAIEMVEDIVLELSSDALESSSQETSLNVSGYLVFTGEPHLVLYADEVFPTGALADRLFEAPQEAVSTSDASDPNKNFGSALIHSIGMHINTAYRHLFPAGVSVNFVRLHPDNVVEYRCFERGIDRESLACGTGALACAYITHHLRGADERITTVLPSRCRWYDPAARIQVSHDRAGWMLESSPTKLYEGKYLALERVFGISGSEQTTKRRSRETAVATEQRQNTNFSANAAAASFS